MLKYLYAYQEEQTVKEVVESVTVGELFTILFGVLFGMAVIAGVFYLIVASRRNSYNSSQPTRHENAVVVDKQQLPANSIGFQVWVMFETERGERVRLLCERNHNYIVGDKGRLSWQGDKLHSFTQRNTSYTGGFTGARQANIDAQLAQGNLPTWKRIQLEEEKARMIRDGNSDGKTVEEVSTPTRPAKKCPECGTTQSGDNNVCFYCGADF